jgi:hypothetical protein
VNAAVLYVLSGTAGKSSSAVCIVRNCWCWWKQQFCMYCQELLVKAAVLYVLSMSGTAGESSSSVCIVNVRNCWWKQQFCMYCQCQELLVKAAVLYVLSMSGTAGESSSSVCIVRNCWWKQKFCIVLSRTAGKVISKVCNPLKQFHLQQGLRWVCDHLFLVTLGCLKTYLPLTR